MRSRSSLLPIAALMTAAACSAPKEPVDPKLSQITVGMSRDSVLQILGPVTATDSVPNVYRKESYLLDGIPLEILYYSPAGVKEGTEPAPAESTLRPIALRGGKVTGWGWAHFDSIARVNDIRVRVR